MTYTITVHLVTGREVLLGTTWDAEQAQIVRDWIHMGPDDGKTVGDYAWLGLADPRDAHFFARSHIVSIDIVENLTPAE